MTRQCKQCKEVKDHNHFSWKLRGKRLASRCHECRRINYHENPDRVRERARDYHFKNRDSVLKKMRQRRINNLPHHLWLSARARARKERIEFTILPSDIIIPKHCPVFGVQLEIAKHLPKANSPSLDRVVPELGYVPTNVRVISYRANTIKNDATEEELESVLAYVRAGAVA